ncbi:MAG: SWIM zinc finger family protein [Nitrospiraceae bacterium]
MRSKIPCSADKLSLLVPDMIQAVVGPSAFKMGTQYVSENRVRIIEADELQISSSVIGNSGLHEQTIRLRDGNLVTKCSCPLEEQPLCRHGVAALLEYHRWVQPPPPRRTQERPPRESPSPEQRSAASATDIKFNEIATFIEWLQPAVRALERGQALPDAPKLGPVEVMGWVQAVQKLEERRRESEAIQVALEADITAREAQLNRATQQLQASIQEAKEAQAASRQMQRELANYRDVLTRLSNIVKDLDRYDGQMRSVAGDLLRKGSQLETLASSFKELSAALQALAKPPSQ